MSDLEIEFNQKLYVPECRFPNLLNRVNDIRRILGGVIIGCNALFTYFFRVTEQHIIFTIIIFWSSKRTLNMTHILKNNYFDLGNRV